jgi:hypothetical protein
MTRILRVTEKTATIDMGIETRTVRLTTLRDMLGCLYTTTDREAREQLSPEELTDTPWWEVRYWDWRRREWTYFYCGESMLRRLRHLAGLDG